MTIKLTKADLGEFRQLIHADQHELVVDARIDPESEAGPNPHDLYDASLAACKAITLLMYSEKAGLPLDHVEISINRDSSEETLGQYRLNVDLKLFGNLDPSQKKRLEKVAGRCPIHKLMTIVDTTIKTTCTIAA